MARLAEERSEIRRFAPGDVDDLFDDVGLQRPKRTSNAVTSLERGGLVSRTKGKGAVWRLTPKGRAQVEQRFGEVELAALVAEARESRAPYLGATRHPVIPPSLSPPELLAPLQRFLADHPFDLNVFGMTRFPEDGDVGDPVGPALELAKEVSMRHGLDFHLASDRAISDDLWTNVAGHMWASRYGVAFFEDRRGRGVNYNLALEVGAMIMTGRRCALLKDRTVQRLPTDLVGRIYREIDLDDSESVRHELHAWVREDLDLGKCQDCS